MSRFAMHDPHDSASWIQAWKEGRTNFHRNEYHEKLVQYFPLLKPEKGRQVLVPLCGKSKDMLWLRDLGLGVHGIELYEGAVAAFFEENRLPIPQVSREGAFVRYSSGEIHVRCGDFFEIRDSEAYDFIYDRGALVAIPPSMRKKYAEVTDRVLRRGGKVLLIAYEYDSSQMQGPPFSLDPAEINRLYGDHFSIRLLEKVKPAKEGPRLASVDSLLQTVFVLEKTD